MADSLFGNEKKEIKDHFRDYSSSYNSIDAVITKVWDYFSHGMCIWPIFPGKTLSAGASSSLSPNAWINRKKKNELEAETYTQTLLSDARVIIFPNLVVSIIRGKHLKVAISFIYLICALKYLHVLSYSIMIISAKRCSTVITWWYHFLYYSIKTMLKISELLSYIYPKTPTFTVVH